MEFVIGAAAGCSAVVFSNPLEVIKTRLQLQGELRRRGTHAVHYRGPLHAAYVIATHDGLRGLQRGLGPAMIFQSLYNSTTLGIYQTMDTNGYLRDENGETIFVRSVAVGGISGGLGAFLASPFSQIKTQLQAMSSSQIAVGKQHDHVNAHKALIKIAREHGFRGLYRGARIGSIRLGVGSATMMATFNRLKEFIKQSGWFPQPPLLHAFLASCVSGLLVALVVCPLDVILTRLYNQGFNKYHSHIKYKGFLDCAIKVLHTEGPRGLYKGFLPLYFRTAPHVILLMFFWEKYKTFYIKYLSLP